MGTLLSKPALRQAACDVECDAPPPSRNQTARAASGLALGLLSETQGIGAKPAFFPLTWCWVLAYTTNNVYPWF